MSYFKELPNIAYPSLLPNRNKSEDRIIVKNIFKRSKLRSDVDQAITAFNYYYIEQGMRPDTVAKKLYDDPELDWVILSINNITNIRNQWPLEHNDLHEYMLDKYGSEENILKIHHYETKKVLDEYDRVIVPEGLEVDAPDTMVNTSIFDPDFPDKKELLYKDGIFTQYLNFSKVLKTISVSEAIRAITNYQYEVKLNDEKRKIKVLKSQFLSVFLTDHKNIMRYSRSSDYISRNLKLTYNPRISGV